MYLCREDEFFTCDSAILRSGLCLSTVSQFGGRSSLLRLQFNPGKSVGKAQGSAIIFSPKGLRVHPTLSSLTRRQRGQASKQFRFHRCAARITERFASPDKAYGFRLERPLATKQTDSDWIAQRKKIVKQEREENAAGNCTRTCWCSAFLCPPP